VSKWLDPFIRTLTSTTIDNSIKKKAREMLLNDAGNTSSSVDNAVDHRLDNWIKSFKRTASNSVTATHCAKACSLFVLISIV